MSPQSVWRCSFVAARPPLAVAAVLARGGSARAFPAVCARVAQHSTKSKGYTSAYGTLAFFLVPRSLALLSPLPSPLAGFPPACGVRPAGCPLRALPAAGSLLPSVGRSGGAFRPPLGEQALWRLMLLWVVFLSGQGLHKRDTRPCPARKNCTYFV